MNRNIRKYRSEATICCNRICVTVHDETADLINGAVKALVMVALLSVVVKALS